MTIKISEEEKVALAVRQQVQGMVTGDIDILNKVIAPDAHFIHITGTDQTKEEWLQQIKIGRMHYFSNKEN
ncbi:nuclear transport factor 2 family protein [Companilactobacillus paralimentarius]|uniref:nuclear transport factor 2 family protein n=1 Tax=Companilactobacillus paralimentarius TaxID=83526 RepID=UPI001D043AFC|nr:nuclear transport factor 2 family protein [Companilactobacillus paralimentarius]